MRRRLPTRAGFAVWRDVTRLRLEQRLQRPLRKGFLRLYHERHLHPSNFVTGTEADGSRASWLGVPTWKLPSDMWVYQEILAETHPELVIETGTQYGGSALFYACVFDLLGSGEVVTIDIDTSAVHEDVRAHPRVSVIEGSSTDTGVVASVRERAAGRRTMLILDSDHQQAHVAEELRMWSDVVSPGCISSSRTRRWALSTCRAGAARWPRSTSGCRRTRSSGATRVARSSSRPSTRAVTSCAARCAADPRPAGGSLRATPVGRHRAQR